MEFVRRLIVMMEELKKKYRVLFGSGSTKGSGGSSEDGDFDYGDDDTLPW